MLAVCLCVFINIYVSSAINFDASELYTNLRFLDQIGVKLVKFFVFIGSLIIRKTIF
jgi:hypothetical protein